MRWFRSLHREVPVAQKVGALGSAVTLVVNSLTNDLSLLWCSASGCPIANRNKMRVLEAGGTVEQHKAAVAAATAMKFDGKC